MAKLKQIKGTRIQFRATDPVLYAGTWSSGGTLNTTRQQAANGRTGIQTAGIATGGQASSSYYAQTEQYNGTAWSEINDLTTARKSLASCATSYTALVVAGGGEPAVSSKTENFNGTCWSEVNDLVQARQQFSGCGTQTAGLVFGGNPGSSALTESWNGTCWTEVNDLNEAVGGNSGGGLQTAGFMVYHNQHEQWNGSAWSETTELNTSRTHLASVGTTTATLTFGGENPGGSARLANTESWNGSAWTEVNDLATGTYMNTGSGTNTSALSFLGDPGPGSGTNTSEEWSFPPSSSSVLNVGDMWFNSDSSSLKGFGVSVPTGTFSSGGANNSVHLDAAAGGSSQSSFLLVSGYPNLVIVESYDGTTWTETGDVNTTRQLAGCSAKAPAPTMLFFGGNPPATTKTELFNGTSWTEVNDLNTTRDYSGGGAGGSSSALCVGGYGSPAAYLSKNESWDGTSWTEVGDLNSARYGGATGGTQSSARCVAGAPPSGVGDKNEGWDGTTWSEQTENSDNSAGRAGFGDSKDSFVVAGGNATAQTEFWNGSSWTEVGATAASGQRINMGGGTTSAGIIGFCSGPNPQAQSTEEFDCDNAVLTVTDS